MQAVQWQTHLAISSFFNTAAGCVWNITFGYGRGQGFGKSSEHCAQPVREGEEGSGPYNARDDELTPAKEVRIQRDRARPQQRNRYRHDDGVETQQAQKGRSPWRMPQVNCCPRQR